MKQSVIIQVYYWLIVSFETLMLSSKKRLKKKPTLYC